MRYLEFIPPFRHDLLLRFLAARAIEGVECVEDGVYGRIVRFPANGDVGGDLGGGPAVEPAGELHVSDVVGWVTAEIDDANNQICVELSPSLETCSPQLDEEGADAAAGGISDRISGAAGRDGIAEEVMRRMGRLFDVDCDPVQVERGLEYFYRVADSRYRIPGIRVPCSSDGFEMAVRAILGQQITVKAASTLAGRVAREFGMPVEGPLPGLSHAFPSFETFCEEGVASRLGELGIIVQRANAICKIAELMRAGELTLRPGADVAAEAKTLLTIRGIGDWTVQYLMMRAYDYPDAFLPTDYGVKKALPDCTPAQLKKMSASWSPWRSYAVMSMWSVPHE